MEWGRFSECFCSFCYLIERKSRLHPVPCVYLYMCVCVGDEHKVWKLLLLRHLLEHGSVLFRNHYRVSFPELPSWVLSILRATLLIMLGVFVLGGKGAIVDHAELAKMTRKRSDGKGFFLINVEQTQTSWRTCCATWCRVEEVKGRLGVFTCQGWKSQVRVVQKTPSEKGKRNRRCPPTCRNRDKNKDNND